MFNGFIRKNNSQEDEIYIFNKLNKLRFCFSAGKEWSPAEEVEDYKEKGLLEGPYKILRWNYGKIYEVIEV